MLEPHLTTRVKLNVNGIEYATDVAAYDLLADVLRNKLGMTGTKRGCDYGGCGCCTLIVGGELVYGCMTPALRAVGKEIRTIEGLERDGRLHPVQQGFIDKFGFQCGYCTPGMIMASVALLEKNPTPTDDEIKEGLSGVLCRCTGYMKIIDSVKAAADLMKSGAVRR